MYIIRNVGIYLCKNLENNHKYILKESRFNDENSNFLSSTLRDNEAKYNFDKLQIEKDLRLQKVKNHCLHLDT